MKKIEMKWFALGGVVLAVLAVAALCFLPSREFPGWEAPEGLSLSRQREIQKELWKIGEYCYTVSHAELDRAGIDQMEEALLEQGLPVLDTGEIYPAYLGNPEGLRQFWENVQNGKGAETSLIRVTEDGSLFLSRFYHGNAETVCVLTKAVWEAAELRAVSCELLPVYDMELADWDIFYYRLFPKDPHYIDYMQVRLTPPDREKYDLCGKYILPIGYQMVNCFLCNWEEGDWGSLSFNDVFEALYQLETGKNQFNWTEFTDPKDTMRARIPAELFEQTLMSYFQISREELRELAGYQAKTGSYPWRAFFGDDLTTKSFPMCEPQVVDAVENEDGTVTLAVRVASPETKTDCLFAHTLVVRPMEDGSFQYVSNQVTEVGQWGLPFAQPRLTLD